MYMAHHRLTNNADSEMQTTFQNLLVEPTSKTFFRITILTVKPKLNIVPQPIPLHRNHIQSQKIYRKSSTEETSQLG